MKRIASTAIAVALGLGFAFGAHAEDKKKLAFVVNVPSDFWKAAEAGMKKAQGELPNYELVFKYPETGSVAVQTRVMDDLIAGGVSGIIVSAVDPKTETEYLQKVAKQVALIITDSDAPKSDRIAYIGSSNVLAGQQAGEIMLKAMPDGGKCMGFVGLLGADNAVERIQGVRDKLKGSNVELVDVRGDDGDQTRAKRNVEDTLTAHPEINCMVGFWSYNTPNIYNALKEAGKLNAIKIIGFDGDPVTLGGVKEGTIAGTVVQQPYEWAYSGFKNMAKYLEGDKSWVPADTLMIVPTKIIDQSNVDAYSAEQAAYLK